MFSRSDFDEWKERSAKESLNGQKGQLEYLVQAEVKQKNLTGDQYWDIFLSYIQSTLEMLKDRDFKLRDTVCSPSTVSPNVITKLKLEIADVGGMIKMAEAVLSLPKGIMEEGEKARERLDDL